MQSHEQNQTNQYSNTFSERVAKAVVYRGAYCYVTGNHFLSNQKEKNKYIKNLLKAATFLASDYIVDKLYENNKMTQVLPSPDNVILITALKFTGTYIATRIISSIIFSS